VENVSRHWIDFQFTNDEIHNLDIEHYENQWKDAMNRYALTIALMHSKW
jgi:hypothetical protein